jgi:hypothetical protein
MNIATKTIVSTIGVMLGIAGINHGFFEALQGNTAAPGLIIQAIGPAQRMWVHGTEEAFTLIPNFLVTGILAMLVGIAIIIWSIGFVHKQHGSVVFILLFVLLFLVGGGIGQIVFFIPAWLVSTRINKPLSLSRKILSNSIGRIAAKIWPSALMAVAVLFLIALEIAIAGYFPGVKNPKLLLAICWSSLLVALGMFCLAVAGGFARDIQ